MTGQVRELVTCVSTRVKQKGCYLIRFWCGALQLDRVVQTIILFYPNKELYSPLTIIIRYLRRQ